MPSDIMSGGFYFEVKVAAYIGNWADMVPSSTIQISEAYTNHLNTRNWTILEEYVSNSGVTAVHIKYNGPDKEMILIYEDYEDFYALRNTGCIDENSEKVLAMFNMSDKAMQEAINFADVYEPL